MAEKIRFGMIGCGQIMPATAKGILQSQKCEIAAVMDIDPEAAEEKAAEYQVPGYTDLWKFLDHPGMDAVYIAVPHAIHVPLGVEAARAGKHVMVEKPMATSVADAKMLADECRKANVKLSVAMGMRYAASSRIAHDLIQQGAIGDVTNFLVRSIGCKDAKYWSNGVFGQAKRSCWRAYQGMAGGGILIMNAVHNLDALYYITGLKPVEVMAMGGTYSARAAVEDTVSLLIRYGQNQAYGVCEAMSSAWGASHTDNTTVIYGTKGTIRFAGKQVELFTTVEGLGYETGKFVEVPSQEGGGDRTELMDGFAEAILSGKEPFITGEDGIMITDLILSAYRSVQSGRVERLITQP